MTLKNKLTSLFLLILLITALLFGSLYYLIFISGHNAGEASFKISPGESFSSINYRLNKAGLINSPRLFYRYSRYKNIMTSFKQGTYTISPGMSMAQVIELFQEGSKDYIAVTIPEGKNFFEIGRYLEQKGLATYAEFVQSCRSQELLKELSLKANSCEGYLYPETYHFSPGTTSDEIVRIMYKEFLRKTKNIDFSKDQLSKHQLITLASMVEKETGAGFERPTIAGVFFNRLKKGMRLQSDPTTIYGIFESFDGNLRKKHILQKTPYNTYKIKALPIGPIANPGLSAIQAVLAPEAHQYLYFVSHNDGTHKFSKSYKEHLAAVEKYQKNNSNRKGKSWRDLDKNKRAN